MKWKEITSFDGAGLRDNGPKLKILFKHSTRCPVSSMALDRLQRDWADEDYDLMEPYFLDLISYRQASNQIASHFNVLHQSPQVLLIKNGECVYDCSHYDIRYEDIKKKAKQLMKA